MYVAELTRGEAGTRDLALEGSGEECGEGEAGEEGFVSCLLRSRKGEREDKRGLAITEFW